MTPCDEILDLLSAQLDGPLTSEERLRLEAHLRACPACRDLARDLGQLHAAMPGLIADPPAGMTDAVMARIRADGAPPLPLPTKRPAARRWQAWGAAAAVLALVFTGTFMLRGGSPAPVNSPAPLLAAPQTDAPSPTATPAPRTATVDAPPPNDLPMPNEAPVLLEKESGDEYTGAVNQALPATPPAVSDSAPAQTAPPRQLTVTAAAPPAANANSNFNSNSAPTPVPAEQAACTALFDHLRAIPYPDLGTSAPWEGALCTGSAETGDLCYTLAPLAADGETYHWHLAYQGLSRNHGYYEFYLYADVTGGAAKRIAQGGWYAVSKAEGTILTYQDDAKAFDAAVNQ